MSLDSNARSQFQARELKSVYVDSVANFLKVRVHRCYINKYNLYNQVGIVAVNILGESGASGQMEQATMQMVSSPTNNQDNNMTPNGALPLQNNMSPFMSPPPVNPNMGSPSMNPNLSFDPTFPPAAARMLKSIMVAKDRAVAGEDFDTAGSLKVAERRITVSATKLSGLESQKKAAVVEEDYERAKSLMGSLEEVRREVDGDIEEVLEEFRALGIDLRAPPTPKPPMQQQMQQFQQQGGSPYGDGGGQSQGLSQFEEQLGRQQQQLPYQEQAQQHMTSPPLNNKGYLANNSTPPPAGGYDDESTVPNNLGNTQGSSYPLEAGGEASPAQVRRRRESERAGGRTIDGAFGSEERPAPCSLRATNSLFSQRDQLFCSP